MAFTGASVHWFLGRRQSKVGRSSDDCGWKNLWIRFDWAWCCTPRCSL